MNAHGGIHRRSKLAALATVPVAFALVAAGCGGSSASTSSNGGGGHASSGSGAGVHTAKVSGVGTVLVDSAGRTLYLYKPDAQKSPTCTGSCASLWPPLDTTGSAKGSGGVKSSLLGTVKAGGKTQVTYDHWPLYTYKGDSGAGQAHGEGKFGKWYAINPAGKAVMKGKSSGGKGGGYSY